MGNAPTRSIDRSAAAAAFESAASCDDNNSPCGDDDTSSTSQVVVNNNNMSAASAQSIPASMPQSTNSSSAPVKFNPNNDFGISIQTLGSGGGSVPTTMDTGMLTIDSLLAGNQQTVGQTLGVALGNNINIAISGDVLLNSLPKDLTPSALGGQLVAVGRLWPGSGRMMRSYRVRVRVPRIDSESSMNAPLEGENNNNRANASSAASTSASAAALLFTIDLVCKAFIVRSEQGEIHLRRTLSEGDAELKRLRALLSDPILHPHVLSHARWIIGQSTSSPSSTYSSSPPAAVPASRPVYLLRQHAHASLSDRLVSRPFLTSIEKTWIAYQLLHAVQSLHDVGVCHGHLTTENVLLTSWNWVLISDLGCQHYKPVALPDDDPGMWIHWFEGRGGAGEDRENVNGGGHHRGGGNGEKKCCLAPERFYTPGYVPESASSKAAKSNDANNGQGNVGSNERGRGEPWIPTELTPAMDVFSLGCVLIELFLNGERALDLGDLMEYRRQGRGSDGEDSGPTTLPQSLKQKLDKIESSKMRAACRHMLSLDPSSRLKPVEYLERISNSSSSSAKKKRGDARGIGWDEAKKDLSTSPQSSTSYAPVPKCFNSTLYPFMLRLRSQILSPDARVALVAIHYGDVLKDTVGVDDEWGVAYFSRVIGPTLRRYMGGAPPSASKEKDTMNCSECGKQKDIANISLEDLLMETEDLLRQLDSGAFVSSLNDTSDHQGGPIMPRTLSMFDNFPQPSSESNLLSQPTPSQTSIIILLQVVLSSVAHVLRPSTKFVALVLMHRIALVSTDEIRLQRIVPFVTSLLQDSEPIVRASAISVLTSVLSAVSTFPPSDASLFPRYVFKKVAHLITDTSLIVRVAFAQNIALLAETSRRFLDVGHSVSLYEAVAGRHSRDRNDNAAIFSEEATNLLGELNIASEKKHSNNCNLDVPVSTTVYKSTYDSDLTVLHDVVYRWVVHITTDTSEHSSQSKQALLRGLPRLCNFFGMEYAFQILPIILAFLNDRKDWQLRAALCSSLPSVCVSVGRAASEQFVVPCIETALNDDVEQVVCEALCCLKALVSLSLLTRISLLGTDIAGTSPMLEGLTRSSRKKQGVIKKCGQLLLHPSTIVRTTAASFIVLGWKVLGSTDTEVVFSRLLRPYLQFKPTFESTSHLCACAKAPSLQNSESSTNLLSLASSTISDESIDISPKLSHSISVPSQMSAELDSGNGREWYETLLRVASESSTMTSPIYSLGLTSLQEVHGVNIELPAVSSNRILMNLMDETKLHSTVGVSVLDRPVVKIAESTCKGEWGSATFMDQLVPRISSIQSTLKALDVPPLPPSLGYSRRGSGVNNISARQTWSPKENKLIGSTDATEHSGPVNRLAVSDDQSYFVSACYDGTSKVFELRQAHETGGNIHSCLTYDGHKSGCEPASVRINDVAILEHTHSVATAASNGSLHVWRVDMLTSPQNHPTRMSRVSGHSALRNINPGEGEVLAISHFNTPSASVLVFATQQGHIHSLDLRCSREPFSLSIRPELGYMTSMEVGNDRNWIVAGTARGYVGLWDIRFQSMVKLWRHSSDCPVKRLTNASCASFEEPSRPLVFLGCGKNEASLFDVSTGGCHQCYRILDSALSYVDQSVLPPEYLSLPFLENVRIPNRFERLVSVVSALHMSVRKTAGESSINALLGGIDSRGPSYIMTGGSDNMIRYWDLKSPSKSCCVSGLERNQPPPTFEQIQAGGSSSIFLCRQPSIHPASLLESSKLPSRNKQGVIMCDGRHLDSILDLKVVKNPSLLLSASRDHTIKLWG